MNSKYFYHIILIIFQNTIALRIMGDRERRTKKNKVDWDEFKAARDGKVSLLERMEVSV